MLDTTANTRCHTKSRGRLAGLGALLGLYRQRRTLANMDTQRLADIGVTRSEADMEAKRPVWDVPGHWRC